MKILHWDEIFHPSFGYQINILAKFQARQGHDVTILTSENIENHPTFNGFANDDDISEGDDLYTRTYGVKIIRLPIHGVISGRVIYKKGYIEKIKELNPDVILCHFNDTLSSIRIAQMHNRLQIPIVFDNHMLDMASTNPFRKIFRFYFRNMVTPIIMRNNWIVIRTQNDNYVNKHLGIPVEQTPFISVGSDTSIFCPSAEVRRRFRENYKIQAQDFVVVYTGKLDESKGGKLLAEAFLRKLDINRNIVLVVVGNTSDVYGVEVEEMFARSQNRIIRFPTQQYTDLPQFYQMADLSVFPKQSSLSFFDAQACALPVISENNNVNSDRLRYHNGFTFAMGDTEDFRNKIVQCAEMSGEEYESMRINALNYVKENYDYEDIAAQYTNILEKEMVRQRHCRRDNWNA